MLHASSCVCFFFLRGVLKFFFFHSSYILQHDFSFLCRPIHDNALETVDVISSPGRSPLSAGATICYLFLAFKNFACCFHFLNFRQDPRVNGMRLCTSTWKRQSVSPGFVQVMLWATLFTLATGCCYVTGENLSQCNCHGMCFADSIWIAFCLRTCLV